MERHGEKEALCKPGKEARSTPSLLQPLEGPTLPTPAFQTSGLQDTEITNFCVNHPASGALLQQPRETDSGNVKY